MMCWADFKEDEMKDQMTHAEAVSKIAELHEEREELRSAMQKAAEQIRRCDYTPARSTLLVALAKTPNAK